MTSRDPIEERINAALKRLIDGKPTSALVREKLEDGKNILTITSVSDEAGVSRTHIGHARCSRPELRASVLKALEEAGPPRPSVTLVLALRKKLAYVNAMWELSSTEAAELLLENQRLRKKLGIDTPITGDHLHTLIFSKQAVLDREQTIVGNS